MMRYVILFASVLIFCASCKKDKFTTAPQIKYKSLSHNLVDLSPTSAVPVITLHITDAEGDVGINGNDVAWVYMKNLLTNKFDSVPFPDLQAAAKKNFEADIDVTIDKVLDCRSLPGNPLHTDTLFFEFYVKDFAKNKSNVITTPEPVYFICF
ncbi:MAG TPA: hypothetical protein PKC54_13030 [Ferruginibacter sp.]|nr:hypothetical protein [Ferruginibacter sp.]